MLTPNRQPLLRTIKKRRVVPVPSNRLQGSIIATKISRLMVLIPMRPNQQKIMTSRNCRNNRSNNPCKKLTWVRPKAPTDNAMLASESCVSQPPNLCRTQHPKSLALCAPPIILWKHTTYLIWRHQLASPTLSINNRQISRGRRPWRAWSSLICDVTNRIIMAWRVSMGHHRWCN